MHTTGTTADRLTLYRSAVAGPVAKQIVDALVEHGYLHPRGMARSN